MEVRKVQLVGRASFSVTLPPDWIKENKIKPSDQVTLNREEDGSLRLTPGIRSEEAKEVKITIDADRCKYPRLLKRFVIGGYNRGCDSIEIVSKHVISENHRKEINDATSGLIGMGIVESTSNRIVLQSVVDPSKFPLKSLLKRLYELASSMYGDAIQALKDKDSSLARSIIQRKNEVDKIYYLAGRQIAAAAYDKTVLNKIGLKGPHEIALHIAVLPRMWSVAKYIVDIANNQLALEKTEMNESDLQKLIRLGNTIYKTLSDACTAFFNEDVILANEAVERYYLIEGSKDELIKDLCPRIKEGHLAMHLSSIIRDLHGIAEYGKFIAEVTIDNSTAEKSNLP